jgi:sucrose phosphorylase
MTKLDKQSFLNEITTHLKRIYPETYSEVMEKLLTVLEKYIPFASQEYSERWNEQDVLLIAYGDSIIEKQQRPLKTLHDFLDNHLKDTFSCVHILPFFPYSSDDGFAVIDYRTVNHKLGDWQDINRIATKFKLMVDLVINHVSRESLWFYDYVANKYPARDYFIELDPETDTSLVTRPRNTPLLVPVNTHRGICHVWATFSGDQIDLNFANPDVLLEFIDILLYYIANGARLVRLDAIAFLWKEIGTTCIHLEETHEVVKLMRDIINHVAADCILLTETNVPYEENLSYFGDADEAHMVYQFSLPPLVLHALNRGTAKYLIQWASELPELADDCTYLNFTASHDGIGLRALEGILPHHEKEGLIESMQRFGGFVSMKANPDGEDSPYEINISLFDAMQGTRRGTDQWQVDRFICSQAIMLGLQGIPALYIHSILATPNHLHGVELTGRTRSINRKQWDYDELKSLLESHNTPNHEVFNELKRIIDIRKNESCFHPACLQEIIDISNGLFSLLRINKKNGKKLLAIYNVTATPQPITLKGRPELSDQATWHDLISGNNIENILPAIILQPYQFMWLVEQ